MARKSLIPREEEIKMEKRINAKKLRKALDGKKYFNPCFARVYIKPIWDGMGYKLIIKENFLSKILTTLALPALVVIEGAPEAWRDISRSWKNENTFSHIFEEANKYFGVLKTFYEEEKGK